MDETETLRKQIEALNAEVSRLRTIEAAAQEAYAFFSGRRPGFAPSYAYDVLRSAFEPGKPRKKPSGGRKPPSRLKPPPAL